MDMTIIHPWYFSTQISPHGAVEFALITEYPVRGNTNFGQYGKLMWPHLRFALIFIMSSSLSAPDIYHQSEGWLVRLLSMSLCIVGRIIPKAIRRFDHSTSGYLQGGISITQPSFGYDPSTPVEPTISVLGDPLTIKHVPSALGISELMVLGSSLQQEYVESTF